MKRAVYNFVFAAGGTGGHLYPAIAVAEQVKLLKPESKILFVGTKKKIESRVIPQMGYKFRSIWLSGFSRKLTLKNLLFPLKLAVSLVQSFFINLKFKPSVAVGAGAYVSGPIVWLASFFGSRIVLLEQNSFPGVTNRMLEKKADSIHLSFEDSSEYFKEKNKLKISGNPVRTTLKISDRNKAVESFGLDVNKKVLLILGGSLGARSINKVVSENIKVFAEENIQVIWQTGEYYFDEYKHLENTNIKVKPFISEMGLAFSACDLLVARAGATTIAEVAFLGMPVIFVPSTNVAANHQYKNAKSLLDKNACLMIEDDRLSSDFLVKVTEAIYDNSMLTELRNNIKQFSKPNAAYEIALDVIRLAENRKLTSN